MVTLDRVASRKKCLLFPRITCQMLLIGMLVVYRIFKECINTNEALDSSVKRTNFMCDLEGHLIILLIKAILKAVLNLYWQSY